ncbi:MAG: glycine cleavage T C-terminal barrel domain-containing protein [Hyphomicrobiaceae bacterium]
MFQLSPSSRIRRSPFFEATVEEGVTAVTAYNQMLMPTGFGDPEGEYWRLMNGVAMWDVACERQVQLQGPDADTLAQILTTRDLTKIEVGQGKYVALCNSAGTLINDPIITKVDERRYWFSIADSNILFWARAIASERRLDVSVGEPDASPLAIQGPRAEDVVASIFGDWVRQIRHFWCRDAIIEGIPTKIARSGWSKQGGYEIYLLDRAKGCKLWQLVREAGRSWNIGPGNPNEVERTESGLLSWGGDTDDETNPFEVRLGRFVDLDLPDDVIGIAALRDIHAAGPRRHQLGIVLDVEDELLPAGRWLTLMLEGRHIGHMTNNVWSYRLNRNIGFGLVETACRPGDRIEVIIDDKVLSGRAAELPFLS